MRSLKSFRERWNEEQLLMLAEVKRRMPPVWPDRPLTLLERFFLSFLVVGTIATLGAILLGL